LECKEVEVIGHVFRIFLNKELHDCTARLLLW